MPLSFKIRNWKLAILALLGFCFLMSLGAWQLSRAQQKKALLAAFTERTLQTPLNAKTLAISSDPRFHRVTLTGTFDNEHSFLLDNKIFHGKVGYQILTPFKADGIKKPILIDRGFIPMGASRQQLPSIRSVTDKVTITGMINTPPTYVALGEMHNATITWPLLVEFIDIPKLSALLQTQFHPYLLSLTPNDPAAFTMEWQVVTVSPEKHMGYAIQWFALAATLLVLFVALNR